tara:strand:- start:1107 stop:1832 length:726 start_codon:yes stop_codon:yes gene_type:complete
MEFQRMRKTFFILAFFSSYLFVADNEVSIDQSGATFNLDVEQLGSGNLIGGSDAIAGTMTALDLDGATMTLDINQIGDANKFKGDITADSFTGFFEFDGDSNVFDVQIDPNNTFGADSSNLQVNITGSSNDMSLDQALSAMASSLDLDWTIQGDTNTIDADIDIDGATNYMNIDGDDNTVNYNGDGFAGGYFHLTHDGNNREITVTQASTQDNDWLKITSDGNNGTFCIIQNDQGTSTSCP